MGLITIFLCLATISDLAIIHLSNHLMGLYRNHLAILSIGLARGCSSGEGRVFDRLLIILLGSFICLCMIIMFLILKEPSISNHLF